jgi:glutamate synthase (ferredoxin)
MKGKRSHDIVQQGLTILINLDHRGAVGSEKNTGDGAGILMQVPDKFLRKVAARRLRPCPRKATTAWRWPTAPRMRPSVPRSEGFRKSGRRGRLKVLGWRDVPVDNSMIGHGEGQRALHAHGVHRARANCPDQQTFERKLYVIRKRSVTAIRTAEIDDFWYCASLSSRTLVYKGMLMPEQVGAYFLDLQDPDMESALALVHSRFSTNTFPSWERSHPYRYIAHNGEINTLRGNINWMKARQSLLESPLFGDDVNKIFPIVNETARTRHVRQRARTARHGRPLAAACDDDDDS